MSEVRVFCPSVKKGTTTILLSPSVGLVKLLVADAQALTGGQVIFELWRLNTCFLVELPHDISGVVVRKQTSSRFFVAFHDEILEVDHKAWSLEQDAKSEVLSKKGVAIVSPMDGMFYLSPSPLDPPFVTVGDEIVPGQTIGLIEVMKSFYPLKYQGTEPTMVIAIHLTNASPVRSGTKIFEVAS